MPFVIELDVRNGERKLIAMEDLERAQASAERLRILAQSRGENWLVYYVSQEPPAVSP